MYQTQINANTPIGPVGRETVNERLRLFNVHSGFIKESLLHDQFVVDQPSTWTQAEKDADYCNMAIAHGSIGFNNPSRSNYSNILNCRFNTIGAGFSIYTSHVGTLRDRINSVFTEGATCRNVGFNLNQVKALIGFSNVPNSKIRGPCPGIADQ